MYIGSFTVAGSAFQEVSANNALVFVTLKPIHERKGAITLL
jgi:hypothetical protein